MSETQSLRLLFMALGYSIMGSNKDFFISLYWKIVLYNHTRASKPT